MTLRRFPLLVLVMLSLAAHIYGQENNNSTEEEAKTIYRNGDLDKKERLSTLKDRYGLATTDRDRYIWAKYIIVLQYNTDATDGVKAWIDRLDSLNKVVGNSDFDFLLEKTKVTYYTVVQENQKAIELVEGIQADVFAAEDTTQMIEWYILQSRIYNDLSDRSQSLKYLIEAEKLYDDYKGEHEHTLILKMRGDIAWEARELEKALKLYIQTADICESLEKEDMLTHVYSDIIATADDISNTETANKYRKKLSDHHKKTGCKRCYFSNELNRSLRMIERGDYQGAINLTDTLIAYADKVDLNEGHAIYLKGVAHRGLDQYQKAAALISHAYDLAKDKGQTGSCQFYAYAMYQTYYWKENYASALQWYETQSVHKDSLYNEKKVKQIAVYEAKLEAIEKQRKVEELEAKIIISKQKKKIQWIISGGLGLLLFMLLYLQRVKNTAQSRVQAYKLSKAEADNQLLAQQLAFKQKELTTQLLNMAQKNTLLKEISTHLKEVNTETGAHTVDKLKRIVNSGMKDNEQWTALLDSFQNIHSSFYATIKTIADNLTSSDLRLASLIRLNMDSKAIASLLNVSDEGVKKARYRLRKKLSISSDTNIHDYILNL